MKLIRLFLLFCFVLLSMSSPCLASDLTPQDFQYSAPLTPKGEYDYTSVRLTPEIISQSNGNLSDLLLISNGQPIPYFINNYSVAKSASVRSYEMALSDSYVKDFFQYLDYRLSAEASDNIVATSINVTASGQFVKDIALYGSYDGLHWDLVGNDLIYQVENSRKLSVELPSGEKYTWYRFRISGNQDLIYFERVWLEYSTDIVSQKFFIETLIPAVSMDQDGKTTVITLNGLKNLELSEIELMTDSMFKRDIYVNGNAHTLYNLTFGAGRYRDLKIPMNGYQCLLDQLELRMDNGDDSPIQMDSVMASYFTYDMVFRDTQAPVTLYWGNDGISEPAHYDIASYKEHILAEGYGKADIGAISEIQAGASKKSSAPDYTMLFNITIIIVAVLLAVLLVLRLKKVK